MADPNAIAVVLGTRPEAIKLAPVILELRRRNLPVLTIMTAQHRELADDVLKVFGITPDFDLDVMTPAQSLAETSAILLTKLAATYEAVRPQLVLTQGDTTTTLAASLAAYYQAIPVGHVEAGLRTLDKRNPFPEEMNRRLTSCLADLHFAPTATAQRALLEEGVPPSSVTITGNTVIDALLWVRAHTTPALDIRSLGIVPGTHIIVVTSHRRENWGRPLEQLCAAVGTIVDRFTDTAVVWPVHPNPAVKNTVSRLLARHERVHLLPPLSYVDFVHLMDAAHFLITDSGGIQEEAPSLAKPVLVARSNTERPEAVEAGTARLVGTEAKDIVAAANTLLCSPAEYEHMARQHNPFGDGLASRRIADAIAARTR